MPSRYLTTRGRVALVVFVLALVVRVASVAQAGWTLPVEQLGGDPADYHEIASNVADGDGFSWKWPGAGPERGELVPTALRAPLWPVALAAVYAVTGSSPTHGRLFLVVLDAMSCVLLALLARRLVSRRAGLVAGLVAALYPPLIINTLSLNTEALFIFVLLLTLLLADRFRLSRTVRNAAFLGLAVGVLTLGRPNGIAVAAGLGAWAMWATRERRADAVRVGAAFAAGVALLVVPWSVERSVRLSDPVLITTQDGSAFAGVYSDLMLDRNQPSWGGWDVVKVLTILRDAPDEATFARRSRSEGVRWISDHPRGAAELVGLHVIRYFDLYWAMDDRRITVTPTHWVRVNELVVVTWWGMAALAVAGVVKLWRRRALAPFAPALWCFIAFAASGLFLVAATRYRAPAEPIVILLASALVAATPAKEPAAA